MITNIISRCVLNYYIEGTQSLIKKLPISDRTLYHIAQLLAGSGGSSMKVAGMLAFSSRFMNLGVTTGLTIYDSYMAATKV